MKANGSDTAVAGVLFDWDLTLARALGDVTPSQRLVALFTRAGFPTTLPQVEAALRATHTADPAAAPLQTREDIIILYQQILDHLGHGPISWQQANALYHQYATLPIELYEDTLPTLAALQGRRIRMGIVSNHTAQVRAAIQALVGHYIRPEHVIISDEAGLYKPAGPIFRQAVAQLQLPPGRCAFVGDNLPVDAIGAVEAGGLGLGLWLDRRDQGADRTLPHRVHRISTLRQVLDFLPDAGG